MCSASNYGVVFLNLLYILYIVYSGPNESCLFGRRVNQKDFCNFVVDSILLDESVNT